MKYRHPESSPARRRAAVLIAVIVCIAVIGGILASMLKMAAAGRQGMQIELWQVQAGWLAESAMERAAARLAADGGYAGETWSLAPEALGGADAGAVRIEVQAVADQPDRRLVRVRADYPDHPQHRARQTREVIVTLRP